MLCMNPDWVNVIALCVYPEFQYHRHHRIELVALEVPGPSAVEDGRAGLSDQIAGTFNTFVGNIELNNIS